jgi:electron transfer flavoprotein alpha subunit
MANALDATLLNDIAALGTARRGLWFENAKLERHYCHRRRTFVLAMDVRPSGRMDEYSARAWLEALRMPLPQAMPLSVPAPLAVRAVTTAPASSGELPARFETPDQLAQWLKGRLNSANAADGAEPAADQRHGEFTMDRVPVWVAAPTELAQLRDSAALRLASDLGDAFAALTWSSGGDAVPISQYLLVPHLLGVRRLTGVQTACLESGGLARQLAPHLRHASAVIVSSAQRELGAALAGQLGIAMFCAVRDTGDARLLCEHDGIIAEYHQPGAAVYVADPAYRAQMLPQSGEPVLVHDVAATAMPASSMARFLARATTPAGLGSAPIIVDAGLGVGDSSRFQQWVEPLARCLITLSGRRVEIGATRRVTQELKLLGADRQIGQTGIAVAPELLLALGISGAPQHMQWIGKDALVIAINRDPGAPIFTWHQQNPGPRVIACVGDLEKWIPGLLDCLKY